MPSFLTQCPHCLTSFRVTDSQLEAADGLVRCGACLGIFSAAANRITLKQTPEEAAAAPTEPELEDDIDTPGAEDEFASEEDTDEFVAVPDDAPEAVAATETVDAASYEFIVPDLPETDIEIEPEPVAPAQQEPEPVRATDAEPDHDVLDQEDFDIPLGDLNLDGEDFEDAAYEESMDTASVAEFDDADEEDKLEDSAEPEYEYDDEEELDEELLATAEEAFSIARQHERHDQDADEEDDEEDELPPPVVPRTPPSRASTDKTELRRHLAQLEDDEALEPLYDEDLDFEDEPVMLDSPPRRGWLATTALLLANVLLITVLALQYADANIDTLSSSASLAPIKPYVCRVVDCPLPERSQLDRLVSEQLLVRSHPRYAQALEVNLVFRNDAAQAQPFPAIELGFHDTGNRLLANRLFQPSEYLPAELRTSDMPARSSYQVQLEMVDPGSEAVNYTLVFRKP